MRQHASERIKWSDAQFHSGYNTGALDTRIMALYTSSGKILVIFEVRMRKHLSKQSWIHQFRSKYWMMVRPGSQPLPNFRGALSIIWTTSYQKLLAGIPAS